MLLLLLLQMMMMMMMMIVLMSSSACRVQSRHQLTNMPPSVRGPEVDSVVIAAFAALVWHTPSLRQHISQCGTSYMMLANVFHRFTVGC